MKAVLFSLYIFLANINSAVSGETLVWGITSFPPGYITEGKDKGQGYADLLEEFMRGELPQYEHKTIVYPNWERQLLTMKQGPLVCTSILWYRPPDERSLIKGAYILSAPNGVFFQHDVVVHKSKRHFFGDEVSFKELLKKQNLRFGYNRPYGITYNRILADYIGLGSKIDLSAMNPRERLKYLQGAKNISVRSSADMIGGMLKMLSTNRVDYILEYDFMVKYQQKKTGLMNEFISIPVTEVKNKMSKIAFACSDTPEGAKAIAAINEVLVKHRNTPEFKKTLSYIVPKGREDLYWNEYSKMLNILE